MKILSHALYLTLMVITKFRIQGKSLRSNEVEKKFIQITLLAVSIRRGAQKKYLYLTAKINNYEEYVQIFDQYLYYGKNFTLGKSCHWSRIINFQKSTKLEVYYYLERDYAKSLIDIRDPRKINMNDRFILFLMKANVKFDIRIRLFPSDLNLKYSIVTPKCIIPKKNLSICLEYLYLKNQKYNGISTPNDCDSPNENYSKEYDSVNYINSILTNTLDNQKHLDNFSKILNFQYKFKNNTRPFITYNSTIDHELNVELFDIRYQSFQIKGNAINIKCVFHKEIKPSEELKTIGNCTENNNSVCLLNGKKTCKDPNSEKSKCNIEADRCNPNPCKNGGSCKLKVLSSANHYRITCTCSKSSHGTICQYSKRCKNCAKGYCNKENQMCSQCNKGWSGDKCSELQCLEGYCRNNGNCSIKSGKRKCLCVNGYTGYHCELKCSTSCNNPACEFKNDILNCEIDDIQNIAEINLLNYIANQTKLLAKNYHVTFYTILYINIISNVAIILISVFAHIKKHRTTTNSEKSGEYILPQKHSFETSKSNKSKDLWVKNTINFTK